jgi:hypothetical protein
VSGDRVVVVTMDDRVLVGTLVLVMADRIEVETADGVVHAVSPEEVSGMVWR